MPDSAGWGTGYRLLSACLLMLHIFSSPLRAEEVSVASRNIFNHSTFPSAYSEAGYLPGQTSLLQSLDRLSFRHNNAGTTMNLEYELNTFYSSTAGENSADNWLTGKTSSGYKKFSTDSRLLNSSRTMISGELERFDFSFSLHRFDFQIGRQPVSFGTSHFVSVIDVLAPFNPGYLDGSFKPGVDALRVRTLAGTTGEAELIFVAADKNPDNAMIGRYRDTFSAFDLELTAGQFRNRFFAAAGFEGERRNYNLWGEFALFERHDRDRNFGGFSSRVAASFIVGAEKSTGHGWRHGLALMHQDFGARDTENFEAVRITRPYQQGWVHLAGTSYLHISTRREMSPLATFNLNIIKNLSDGSALFQPMIHLNTSDESDLAFFGWFNLGPRPVYTAPVIQTTSEFGSFNNGAGIIYRRFFQD